MFGSTQGCRRCSTCSIHYPTDSRHEKCEVCGEPTSFFSNVSPDPEWEDAVKYASMHPKTPDRCDPHNHRFEQYLRMGWTEVESQLLALATWGSPPFPLYPGLVKTALDSGVDRQLVFESFS